MMTINSTKMGEAIATLRAKRKLSRPSVAREVGVTSNYLGMVEAGKRTLSAVTLEKLAVVFDVPPEFITCLGSNIPVQSDSRHRFAKLLLETQKAMIAAIDADEKSKQSE
jgi:transcriptional regulator with XRE-family HTH domain